MTLGKDQLVAAAAKENEIKSSPSGGDAAD